MGLSFSKPKKNNTESETKPITKPNIKQIIQHYEYIKETKGISNIDTILSIVENTDWDKVEAEYIPLPSAPPLPIAILIK